MFRTDCNKGIPYIISILHDPLALHTKTIHQPGLVDTTQNLHKSDDNINDVTTAETVQKSNKRKLQLIDETVAEDILVEETRDTNHIQETAEKKGDHRLRETSKSTLEVEHVKATA